MPKSKNNFKILLFLASTAIILFVFFYFYPKYPKYIEVGQSVYSKTKLTTASTQIDPIAPISDAQMDKIKRNSTADAVLAYNPNSSHILFQQNADKKLPIASLTKLMTAVVIIDSYNISDIITAPEDIPAFVNANNLNIKKGDSISVEDGIKLLLISSYNDVAVLFEKSYNGNFIDQMNKTAQKLGMSNTNFSTPNGYYDSDNYSTAKDLKILTTYFLQNDYLKNIVSSKSAKVKINRAGGYSQELTITTTNKLLEQDSSVKGIKTGYTNKAGECFIGYYDLAGEQDDLIIILLNSNRRFTDTKNINSFL